MCLEKFHGPDHLLVYHIQPRMRALLSFSMVIVVSALVDRNAEVYGAKALMKL